MSDLRFRRFAGLLLALMAWWAARPPSAGAATVVLSDNITGVATGGAEAATGSNWLAASFGTGDATYRLQGVTNADPTDGSESGGGTPPGGEGTPPGGGPPPGGGGGGGTGGGG